MIGAMARCSPGKTRQQWQATVDYPNEKIPRHTLKIALLDFQQIGPATGDNHDYGKLTGAGSWENNRHLVSSHPETVFFPAGGESSVAENAHVLKYAPLFRRTSRLALEQKVSFPEGD